MPSYPGGSEEYCQTGGYYDDRPVGLTISERHAEMNAGALTTYGEEYDLKSKHQMELLDFAPDQRIKQAEVLATQLRDVIDKQKLYQTIGKKKHVTVEGWETVGILAGVTAREVESHRDDLGWHATVELVRVDNGQVVGRASSLVGHTEKLWCDREEYARKSMATTRATGKAFRLTLAWVVCLAGYSGTPAEEMVADKEDAKQTTTPRKPKKQPPPPATPPELKVRSAELLTMLGKCGDADDLERVGAIIKAESGDLPAVDVLVLREKFTEIKGFINTDAMF